MNLKLALVAIASFSASVLAATPTTLRVVAAPAPTPEYSSTLTSTVYITSTNWGVNIATETSKSIPAVATAITTNFEPTVPTTPAVSFRSIGSVVTQESAKPTNQANTQPTPTTKHAIAEVTVTNEPVLITSTRVVYATNVVTTFV